MKHTSAKAACRELWDSWAELEGVRAWGESEELLDRYVALLLKGSEQRNLIALSQRNLESIWGHIYDSLQVLRMVRESAADVVMDAGSGNGLPGLVLAVGLPAVRFVLVERAEPKAEFLELAAAKCGLRNVQVRCTDLSGAVIDAIDPGVMVMRAVVNADAAKLPPWLRALRCPWIVFATAGNRTGWNKLAESAGFVECDAFEYADISGQSARLLLKFARP